MPSPSTEHISVCICTFRRPELLSRLLKALLRQDTGGLFDHSVVVVDNDHEGSARLTAEEFARSSMLAVTYVVEPRQNISLARNKAIATAGGNYVALIDDDELPDERWLLDLYQAIQRLTVDGVLAPVLPRFTQEPPSWVLKGRFFDRPAPASGHILRWTETRSGNALLRRAVFEKSDDWFDPALGSGGEDRDFFKRKIAQGLVFAWTNEGAVHEWVPAMRWKRGFLLKRAMLRGKMALRASNNVLFSVLKSTLAIPIYCLALPVAAVLGHHVVMHCLVRACDHLGKLLAFLGVSPVEDKYVQADPTAHIS